MATDKKLDLDVEGEKKTSPLLRSLMYAGFGLVLVAVNVAATFFLVNFLLQQNISAAQASPQVPADAAKPSGPPLFVPLAPMFVVNFDELDKGRFLQTDIEILTRDPDVENGIRNHMPMIRNAIILLLAGQDDSSVGTREGKDGLREKVQSEVEKILEENIGKGGVEEVYFTSFVTQ